MTWHVLDVGSIWLKEFASALSGYETVQCWAPRIRSFGWFESWNEITRSQDPSLTYTVFPLQRGYGRFPLRRLLPLGNRMVNEMLSGCPNPNDTTLVCTNPYYAAIAEKWPGRVVYYVTDFAPAYDGADPGLVHSLERRMVTVASLVCPNSQRTAHYLRSLGCPEDRLVVIPNATRERNIADQVLSSAATPPGGLENLRRPIAGVIGNLARNMDWVLLKEIVSRLPWLSWVFVGPGDMAIHEPKQRAAREALIQMGGRVRFTGPKPYGDLWRYSRAFDVAVLPYLRQEPTFSGSATRYYEHLAACRPILATRGVEELLHKEPLLKLVDTADEAVQTLGGLRQSDFRDGFEQARWNASRYETWECRAMSMVTAVKDRCERKEFAASVL